MSESAYEAFDDPYSYPGTDCLKNRAGLRDSTALTAFEVEMSSVRGNEPLPVGRFGPTHYCRVHHHLFQDVYDWAGRYRTVRTAKAGNVFCYPEHIDSQMQCLFKRLALAAFRPGVDKKSFVSEAAAFLAELNAIHPFREGNGRTQLAFMHLIGLKAGWPFRFEDVRQATFLPAMIESFSGRLASLTVELERLCVSD